MSKMLLEGSRSFSSKQLRDGFDKYGAFVDCYTGQDYVSLTLHTLSKHLQQLIPMLAQIINAPTFPKEELYQTKQIQKQNLEINNQKNSTLASKKIRELIYGTRHPYGALLSSNILESIGQDDLNRYHKDVFLTTIPEVFLSGKFDNSTINALADLFAPKVSPLSTEVNYPIPDQQTNIHRVHKKSSLQSSIRMGKIIINRTHSDYFKLLVTNEILGGYFGSRLMKNIREKKGYTYGIHSSIVHFKHSSYLMIGTDVKSRFEADTIEEINKEILKMQTDKVSNSELRTVKNYIIGEFQSQINSPFALMDKFKAACLHQFDYSFYNEYTNQINQVKVKDIIHTAQKYLKLNSFTTLVVGP